MTDIIAKAICDSYGENSPRLLTMFMRNPKMIHQETLRHRKIYIQDFLDGDFSFSVSSARAIPFAKMLEEVRSDDRASPVYWGAEQRGMSPGGELVGEKKRLAKIRWRHAAINAADYAENFYKTGVHKSLANRIIEPYLHVNTLCTATENGWLNFFGLRLDKAADPTLKALAEQAWIVWNESKPQKLNPGEWHLPYADDEETILNVINSYPSGSKFDELNDLIKISVSRCARLSYQSFTTQKRSTIEEDLELYQKLVGSYPIHASPAEHQATPDQVVVGQTTCNKDGKVTSTLFFKKPHLSGNLGPGWIQYRKLLPNEAIAPLPEGYKNHSPQRN